MTSVERTWSCKCGQVHANLKGDPTLNFNCHCRSCVAAARFIAEKTNNSGTPMINSTGGTSPSAFKASQVEFCTDVLSDPNTGVSKIKFVRVGEKGNAWRSYTTCCGTQMTNAVFPEMIVLNRNGIKNEDGTTYTPPEVLNIMKDTSFDPDSVPEPNHASGPMSFGIKFMWHRKNPFSKKFQQKELFPDQSEAEIVPITWE